jgi:hypothetical protein
MKLLWDMIQYSCLWIQLVIYGLLLVPLYTSIKSTYTAAVRLATYGFLNHIAETMARTAVLSRISLCIPETPKVLTVTP